MTIQYKVISTFKPGAGKEGEKIYFPRLTGSTPANLEEMAGLLAQRTSASRGDVYLVLTGLAELIPELLSQGKTVRIDRLGSFALHAKVLTSDSPEEVSYRNIKELRLRFKADKEIKKMLKRISFKKQE